MTIKQYVQELTELMREHGEDLEVYTLPRDYDSSWEKPAVPQFSEETDDYNFFSDEPCSGKAFIIV